MAVADKAKAAPTEVVTAVTKVEVLCRRHDGGHLLKGVYLDGSVVALRQWLIDRCGNNAQRGKTRR